MKVFISITILLWSLLPQAMAQTPRAYETAAVAAFAAKDYYAAMKYYEQALDIEPDRADLRFHFADAARMFGALSKAEQSYEKVVADQQFKDLGAAIYGLAMVKKTLGKYDQAIFWFQQFQQQEGAASVLQDKVREEIDNCEWALEQINHPDVTIQIERLPEDVNTSYSEFAANQYGNTLFYSSFRNLNWKDKHYPPRPILKIMELDPNGYAHQSAAFNAPFRHTAHLAMSPDGLFAIFNYCDYEGETDIRCELYCSRNIDGTWTQPEMLPESLNFPGYTATQPNLVSGTDGTYVLYFVSDRPGGKGGLDIWTATIAPDGSCTAAENLAALNTIENDVTPFFQTTSKTLFFSTMGWPTLGGYDVYSSQKTAAGWAAPVHLGLPINSSFNDLYYAPQADNWAFFASNRIGSSNLDADACCYDLYKCTILPLNLDATVMSEMTGESLTGVEFTLIEEGQNTATHFTHSDIHSRWDIARDKNYTLVANKEGYLPDTIAWNTTILPNDRRFVKRLYLKPDIRLAVATYDQLSDEALAGVTIRLF
ncbi:MAG: tetratricopeptide repeat protein [Lewinellaceae bacterium]|nr:tetratricopeptide repeat protein [Lewinellaceae bacterium]